MKKSVMLLLATLMLLTLTACGIDKNTEDGNTILLPASEETAIQQPNGKLGIPHDVLLTEEVLSTQATIGQTIAIYLQENPSTGYAYTLSAVPEGLTLTQDEYAVEPVESGVVGSGGIHIYTFTADAAGTYTLTANLMPPGADTPETTYTFTITVS